MSDYFSTTCYCDYDPPSIYSQRIIKRARKQSECCECGVKININDSYEYTFGVWEGYANSFKTCLRCVELREWAKISVPCFCWYHGDMLSDVWEMVNEVRHDVPGFFFEYGRRAIKIKRAGGHI